MRLRSLALLAAAALPCLQAHAQFYRPSPGSAREKPPGAAAYAPPVSPVPNWYLVRGGTWEVPLATVREMLPLVDAKIGSNKSFGDKARTAGYAIQFRGETRDGHPVVRLAGACSMETIPAWQLSSQFLNVQDGGTCFFDAEYDPESKRLSHFNYHGYA